MVSHIFLSSRSGVAETMITAASVLGKGDPKSGQIAGHLDRQPHLKSRHSRTYASGCEWHATWLFNMDEPEIRREKTYDHSLARLALWRANDVEETWLPLDRRVDAGARHRG